ncbi:MAG: hypothetical protein HOK97_07010, partial [Deltaproteobacteria bacterium]|nr:hypothetical protein [Deltaproteobacteria bacterium]
MFYFHPIAGARFSNIIDVLCFEMTGCLRRRESLSTALMNPAVVRELIDDANSFKVGVLVQSGLSKLGVDSQFLGIKQCQHQAMASSMYIQRTREDIEAVLGDSGIRYAILKGVASDLLLYGGLGQRGTTDIDLLIDPEQQSETFEALATIGYYPQIRDSHRVSDPEHFQLLLCSSEPGRCPIDLHMQLNCDARFKDPGKGFLSRAQSYSTHSGFVRALEWHDQLTYLSLNLSASVFRGGVIKLLLDAYALLSQKEIDM